MIETIHQSQKVVALKVSSPVGRLQNRGSDAAKTEGSSYCGTDCSCPHGADARATLLQAGRRPKLLGQRRRLHVLKDHQLSSLELSDLVEKVTSGKTDPSLDSLLLTLLASQVLEGEGSTKLLSFLLDRNSGDGLLQARIRSLLTSRARSSQSGQGG